MIFAYNHLGDCVSRERLLRIQSGGRRLPSEALPSPSVEPAPGNTTITPSYQAARQNMKVARTYAINI